MNNDPRQPQLDKLRRDEAEQYAQNQRLAKEAQGDKESIIDKIKKFFTEKKKK